MSDSDESAMRVGILKTQLGFRMRVLQNLLGLRRVKAFAHYRLSHGAFTTMALISVNPGSSQVALAREVGLDKSAMVALLDELEKAGLATRDRSAEDRRRNLLALTPSGKRVLEEMHALSLETERPVRDALSENELKTLFDLTERAYQAVIADDLRAAEEDAGPDKAAQAASSSDGSSAPALVRRGRSPRFGLSRI